MNRWKDVIVTTDGFVYEGSFSKSLSTKSNSLYEDVRIIGYTSCQESEKINELVKRVGSFLGLERIVYGCISFPTSSIRHINNAGNLGPGSPERGSMAMKYLKKFGYTGGGLGVHEQGIASALEIDPKDTFGFYGGLGLGYQFDGGERQTKDVVEQINNLFKNTADLRSLALSVGNVRSRYNDNPSMINAISKACIPFIVPLFLHLFEGWEPLRDIEVGVDLLDKWKQILAPQGYIQLFQLLFPKERLIQLWAGWETTDPEPLINFFQIWERLTPSDVLHQMFEIVVLPHLVKALGDINDNSIIEVDPNQNWTACFKQKLEWELHGLAFGRFAALIDTRPQKDTTFNILSAWKDVFHPCSWKLLIEEHVGPAMSLSLHRIKFAEDNTSDSDMEILVLLLKWARIMPRDDLMLQILETFFLRLQEVLESWTGPDCKAMANWFFFWTEAIPFDLLDHPKISSWVRQGLEFMMLAAGDLLEIY